MSKRILALLLVFAFLLPFIPQPAQAAELTPLTLTILPEENFPFVVYTDGSDLYFSGDDLTSLTDFYYENDGKKATFTRGSKVIKIELAKGKFDVLCAGTSPFGSRKTIDVTQIGGEWYFSGATLLPWLNVSVCVDEGRLVILSDEWSFWDICEELNLDKYWFDFGDMLSEYSYDSKVFKAMNYMDDSVGQTLQENLNYEDEYDGSAEDYFELFECLLLDTAHNDYLADTLHDAAEVSMDIISLFGDEFDDIFSVFQIANDGLLFASHYCSFTANHSERMNLIRSITSNGAEGVYTDQLADGALLAKTTYSSWWQGLLNQYVLNLDEYLIDGIQDAMVSNPVAEAILLAIDVQTKEIQDLNDRIGLMAPLFNLYATGKEVYAYRSSHIVLIEEARCHGIISLYGAAENFRTLSAYSERHKLYDLAKKYQQLARECDEWMSILNACYLSQVNDSINYPDGSGGWDNNKDAYTEQLLDLFAGLDGYSPTPEGLEQVEYGIFLEFAEELPLDDPTWNTGDFDDDGLSEFVLFAAMERDGSDVRFQYEMDVSDLRSWVYITDSTPDYDNPCLTDMVIPGDPAQLLNALDSYFESRENFRAAYTADLNSDGQEDRLYILPLAFSLWLDRLLVNYQDEDFFPPDTKTTLVVAEPVSGGIRVRIMRIDLCSDYSLSDDGTLIASGVPYTYQSEGDPFVEDTEYLLDLCGLTYAELYERFWATAYSTPDIYGDGNVWNYACMLGPDGAMVFEFASDYEDPNATPISVRIDDFASYYDPEGGGMLCPGVKMGMTYAEVAGALELTELVDAPVGGTGDLIFMCYSGTMGCALELYFVGSDQDSAVLSWVYATPVG